MRLKQGDKISSLNLPSIEGKNFTMQELQGKKALITFYRFASCPFCNLRINEMVRRYDELGDNFKMVAIFDSPLENLKKYTNKHDAPFWILADEQNTYFNKYSVEKSFFKFLKGTTIRFHRLLFAMTKGYIPSMIPKGSFSTVPVDILISKDGVVERAYYAKDTSDHLSFDTVKEFSKN